MKLSKKYIIIQIIVLIVSMCIMTLNVYSKEIEFTGTSLEDLHSKIQAKLDELGCNKDVAEAANNAPRETIGSGTATSGVKYKYEIKWKKNGKEYIATINESYGVGQGYVNYYKALVNLIEKDENTSNNGEDSEVIKGSIGPCDTIKKVEDEIFKILQEKGCTSQEITDGKNNTLQVITSQGYNSKYTYQITWKNDNTAYTAYIETWGRGIQNYGNVEIKEGSDISEDIKPNSKPNGILGTSTPNGNHTIDEVINEGSNFIDIGKNQGGKIDSTNLKSASNTIYNILLGIGVFLTVAVGMYLAIKFMISSVEEKAQVKESLIPYIAGCVIIFGAFTIWKLAITLLSGIA